MRDDISARGKDGAAGGVTAFRRRPSDFDFRRLRGEYAVGQCDDTEQDDHGDSAENEAARPRGRFSASIAQRAIDVQAAEILMLGIVLLRISGSEIRGHCCL